MCGTRVPPSLSVPTHLPLVLRLRSGSPGSSFLCIRAGTVPCLGLPFSLASGVVPVSFKGFFGSGARLCLSPGPGDGTYFSVSGPPLSPVSCCQFVCSGLYSVESLGLSRFLGGFSEVRFHGQLPRPRAHGPGVRSR